MTEDLKEQKKRLWLFDERIHYNGLKDGTLFLEFCFGYISILVKKFSSLVVENNTNIIKDSSKLKKKKVFSLSSKDQQKKTNVLFQWILQFCDGHSNMLQNQNQQSVRNNLFWSWYILHLNEWCQACPIWWQVFIYCFTDNILHRVTLEVKSPDRTLYRLVGDRGEDKHTFIKHTL